MLKNTMGRPRGNTRSKLVDGAFDALRTRGYRGATSRAIGEIAGVNPALVFYYFESVDDLLVTALAESSRERLSQHRATVEAAHSPSNLVAALARIYRDDVASGHIAVVSELVAASVSRPQLAVQVMTLMEPWIELAEVAVRRVLSGSPLGDVASARSIALAGVTFYLGANLLTHLLAPSEDVEGVLEQAERLGPVLDAFVAADRVDT